MMKQITLLVIILALLTSCSNIPKPNTQATIEAIVNSTMSAISTNTHVPTITAEPTPPSDSWKIYTNTEFGFSIKYPSTLEPYHENNDSLYIGKQIFVSITEWDPWDCRGDCPVIESEESMVIAGKDAIQIHGYIGTIGGNTPHQYLLYVINHNNLNYQFALHATAFDDEMGAPDILVPLAENDIILFEQILETLEFEQALSQTLIQPEQLDQTDIQSVLRWVSYAILENEPEMISDLIGDNGTEFGARFSSSVAFPGVNNSDLIVSELQKGLQTATTTCMGYSVTLNARPDKANIYFSGINFEWNTNIIGFIFFYQNDGWDMVAIAPIPTQTWPNLYQSLWACP